MYYYHFPALANPRGKDQLFDYFSAMDLYNFVPDLGLMGTVIRGQGSEKTWTVGDGYLSFNLVT